MFDNPKKELERLQQQLLAAEEPVAEEDSFYDEQCDDPDASFDDDLAYVLDEDSDFSSRSAGFDIQDEPYVMDTDRYVPAPKKKGVGCLLFIAFLELIAAGALIAWWMGWLG